MKISNKVLCAEYEAVYRYTLSLCKNKTEALDITQETFLKVLNARQNFKGTSSLYTWICSISKNIWLSKCEKNSKLVQSKELLDVQSEQSFEQYLENKDSVLMIHKAYVF